MKVIVLKVRHRENLEELAEVIRRGRTLHGDDGGWQMPKYAEVGDLAIWYAASPDQEYRAYGWVAGTAVKPAGELVKHYGPVVGVRLLPRPVPRHVVAAASGFNEKGVGQLAEMVHHRVHDFLLAVGFDDRFVAAREQISDEVARVLRSTASGLVLTRATAGLSAGGGGHERVLCLRQPSSRPGQGPPERMPLVQPGPRGPGRLQRRQ